MNGRRWGVAVLVLGALCAGLLATAACTSPMSCARTLAWPLIGGASATAVVAACLARGAWLAVGLQWRLRRLAVSDAVPPGVRAIATALGVRRLRCLEADDPIAFTGGALRPRVWVSRGLLDTLGPDAARAVVAHEAHHARRRDPLRRAVRHAIADVLVMAPVLRWWAEWGAERDELAADRASLRVAPARSVAAALLMTATSPAGAAVAAFDGAVDARVAQLLGERLPARRCPLRLLAASLIGTGVAVAAVVCGAQLLAAVG